MLMLLMVLVFELCVFVVRLGIFCVSALTQGCRPEELPSHWEEGRAPPEDGPSVPPMYDGSQGVDKSVKNIVLRLACLPELSSGEHEEHYLVRMRPHWKANGGQR